MTSCAHKTSRDFKRAGLWRCSTCGVEGTWTEGWGYRGSLECTQCGWAAIEAVFCEACNPLTHRKARRATKAKGETPP